MLTHIVRFLIPLWFFPACAADQQFAADASHVPEEPFTLTVRLAHQILSVQFPLEAPKTSVRRYARASSHASSCARMRRLGIRLISLDGLTVLYPTRAVSAVQDFTTPCVPKERPDLLPHMQVAGEAAPLPALRPPVPDDLSTHLYGWAEMDVQVEHPFQLSFTPRPRPLFEPDGSVWQLRLRP